MRLRTLVASSDDIRYLVLVMQFEVYILPRLEDVRRPARGVWLVASGGTSRRTPEIDVRGRFGRHRSDLARKSSDIVGI